MPNGMYGGVRGARDYPLLDYARYVLYSAIFKMKLDRKAIYDRFQEIPYFLKDILNDL